MSPSNDPAALSDGKISGEEKLRRVSQLIEELRIDLKEVNFLPHERNAAMEQLKVFGKDPENADPIFTKEGIEILTRHSFHSTSPTTSRAALQCLVNALLSKPCTRQMFVDLGYSVKATARLKKPKKDDELLISRLLFLTSYGTTQSFSQLIEVHHLSDYINDNIARHSRKWAKSEVKGQAGYGYQTLSETLKLLFNITHFCPQKKAAFSQSIVPILKILTCHEFSSLPRPVHPPINHLINALLNLNLEEKKGLHGRSFQKVDLRASIEKLTRILDITLKAYAVPEFNTTVVPLLTLLKCLATISPPNIRCLMKSSLLPTRQQLGPLPVDDSLPSRLLRLMAKPVTPLTYDALTNLFFELSDRDPEQAINRLGVGMMGGFVLSRNLQLPAIPSDTASIHSAKSCSSIRSQATSDVSRPPSPDAPEEQNSTLSCEVPLDEHP